MAKQTRGGPPHDSFEKNNNQVVRPRTRMGVRIAGDALTKRTEHSIADREKSIGRDLVVGGYPGRIGIPKVAGGAGAREQERAHWGAVETLTKYLVNSLEYIGPSLVGSKRPGVLAPALH